jgi:hypothetical protein
MHRHFQQASFLQDHASFCKIMRGLFANRLPNTSKSVEKLDYRQRVEGRGVKKSFGNCQTRLKTTCDN